VPLEANICILFAAEFLEIVAICLSDMYKQTWTEFMEGGGPSCRWYYKPETLYVDCWNHSKAVH